MFEKDEILIALGALNRHALSPEAREEELPDLARVSGKIGRTLRLAGVRTETREHRMQRGTLTLTWALPGAKFETYA